MKRDLRRLSEIPVSLKAGIEALETICSRSKASCYSSFIAGCNTAENHAALFVSGFTRCVSNPRSASRRKSTVCGINGIPSSSRALARRLPFISSTTFRALAPPAFFRGALCFASLSAGKIWHSIFFRSKANSKIISPRLLLRRRALPDGFRETRDLRFFRTIRPGASNVACR
jgi:hypothetical protein